MIALTPRQWVYAGAALAVAAALVGAYSKGRTDGRVAEAQRTARLIAAANEAVRQADAKYANSRSEATQLQAKVAELLARPLPDPRILVREVPTHAPVTTCPDLSPDFRVQYNATATAGR